MNELTILTEPVKSDGDFGDMEHWSCDCDSAVALCGVDLSESDEAAPIDTPDDCVVCADLVGQPCGRCGL